MLLERLCESMGAVRFRYKELIVRRGRVYDCFDRIEPRAANWTRWQTALDPRVVWRVDIAVFLRKLLLPIPVFAYVLRAVAHRILHRRVRLQREASSQPLHGDLCQDRSLFQENRLSL